MVSRAKLSWLRNLERYLICKYGTRGVLLWHLAIPWFFVGIGFMLNPIERFSRPGPGGPLEFMDRGPWLGLIWIIGGLCGFVSSFLRVRTRDDTLGFNGVTLPPFIMGLCYFWSWGTNQVTDGEIGRPSAWLGFLVYMSVAMLLVFLARNLKDEPGSPEAWSIDK